MKFEIWSDQNEGAVVLIPFPDGGRPDTSGPEWEREHTFEVESYADAQYGFDAWMAGRDSLSRYVSTRLTAHFSREKANAIVDAVGCLAAREIAHAMDFEDIARREEEQRQRAIQMAKERRVTR